MCQKLDSGIKIENGVITNPGSELKQNCYATILNYYYYFYTLGSTDPKGYKLRVKNKAGLAIGLDSRCKRNCARAQN